MNEFAFRPTHVAPQDGMPSWATPDPSQPTAWLDPLLPVQLLEQQGDWSRILCSNGWSAWVDGRLLISLPAEPRAPTQPLSRTADPRPMLAEAERALARHRALLEDLAGGRTDLENFARSTRGLRIGLVIDGDALWLFDQAHDRWCYCDGLQLQTYAATARHADVRPGSRPESGGVKRPAAYEPTQAGEL